MSYLYPQALDAMQVIASDLLKKLHPTLKHIVKVVADATTGTASVDWHNDYGNRINVTIHMPVRPATHRMTQRDFDHWAAYVLHEVGHPAFTSKKVWDNAVAANKHRLLNSLEDVREEKLTIASGVALNAKSVLSGLIDHLGLESRNGGYDVNEPRNIGWTMAYLGRVQNGYAMDDFMTPKLDANGPVAKVLAWALPALDACASTQDCFDLATRVMQSLPRKKPEAPVEQPPVDGPVGPPVVSHGEDSVDGDEQEGAGDEQSEAGEAGDEQAYAEGEDSDGEAEDKAGKGGEDAAGPHDKDAEALDDHLRDDDIDPVDLQPEAKNTLPEGTHEWAKTVDVLDTIREAERLAKRVPQPIGTSGSNHANDQIASKAAKMARQRALLAQCLKANEQDSYEGGMRSGRLDKGALVRAVTGSQTVFGKRTVSEGYDTDVQVLVDGSGSMSHNKIQAAAVLSMVVAQACAQVGVPCTVSMFGTNGEILMDVTTGRKKPVPTNFAAIMGKVGGGTPLSKNMMRVAKAQFDRAAHKRRVLFVITDGQCDMGKGSVRTIGEYIEQSMGGEVAGMMIGQALKQFRNEVAVDAHADITSVGLGVLTRQMQR